MRLTVHAACLAGARSPDRPVTRPAGNAGLQTGTRGAPRRARRNLAHRHGTHAGGFLLQPRLHECGELTSTGPLNADS